MKISKAFFLISSVLLFITIKLYPQQTENTRPIELPNVIIEGKEQLNIRSGIKQSPDNTKPMSKEELDSLNNLEKQPALLIPPKPIEVEALPYKKYYGLLIGEFGRFLTPYLSASYSFSIKEYDFFIKSEYEGSQGHRTNADYNKFNLKIASDYIAPKKFWIFGGSRTKSDVSYKLLSYKTYASTTPEKITSNFINANIESIGEFEGFNFKVGANLDLLSLNSSKNLFESNIQGNLTITKTLDKILWGGTAIIDYDTYDSQFPSFFQTNVVFGYFSNNLHINTDFGFQLANNSVNSTKFAPLLNFKLDYLLNENFTLNASLKNYLNHKNFYQLYFTNIYLSDTAVVDFGNTFSLGGGLTYFPNKDLAISGFLEYINYSRLPYYEKENSPFFLLYYNQANSIQFNVEANWQFTTKDRFSTLITLNNTILNYNNNTAPYTPLFKTSVNYQRFWTEKFQSQFILTYFSKRFADKDNTRKLDGFLDFRANVEYNIFENINVYAKIEDLFNSNIEIWEGYKERNLFFSLGAKIKF